MNRLQRSHRADGDKQFFHYPELGVTFFKAFIPRGTKQSVYKHPEKGDGLLSPNKDGMSKLKTITVIPPGSYIRYHSDALDRPAEWPGTWELVAGGLHPVGSYTAEAVEDSWYLCVSPSDRSFFDACQLRRVLLAPGEAFTVDERTVGIVVMAGGRQDNAYAGEVGESFTANATTLLAIVERDHVRT